MRESLILIICLSAISVRCSNLDDGFNLYKNYLRALRDKTIELDPEREDPVFYFYRTPVQLYPGLLPESQVMKYRKRDWGIIKSHMLNKEMESSSLKKRTSKAALSLMLQSKHADHIDKESSSLKKRTSKAALSLMLQSKHADHMEEGHYCPYGK